jgi:hypothetical protein
MLPLVKHKNIDRSAQKLSRKQLLALWPAAKGSLALVYKPCIRANCRLCARGDKHPNYLLSFTEAGQRRCLYVPKAMVPVLKQALKNGRQIERLLYATGPALLKEYRAQNPTQTGPAVRVTRTSAKRPRPKS